MKFVATKTTDQLDLQALHRVRERLVGQRTAIINQIRAFLLERGVAVRLQLVRNEVPSSRLLKKVFGRSRCATLIQPSILGRTKDSPPRDFGFENYASSTDFRVFQQPARRFFRRDQTRYSAIEFSVFGL